MYAPKFDKLLRIYDGKNDLNTRYECNEVKEKILKLFLIVKMKQKTLQRSLQKN